jgi:hypothetical protein
MRPGGSALGSRSTPGSSVATMGRTHRRGGWCPSQVVGQESMEALRDNTPPGGSLGIVTEREELFDVVEEY